MVGDLKEAPAGERPTKFKKVEAAIDEGEKAFAGAAKNLVVAHNHGWEVVRGLQGAAYAKSEEEQKKLKAAIKTAELVVKSGKGAGQNTKERPEVRVGPRWATSTIRMPHRDREQDRPSGGGTWCQPPQPFVIVTLLATRATLQKSAPSRNRGRMRCLALLVHVVNWR
ncbi:hypothetical protein Vafri_12133 [Volvox africanus]|uniref:Uncharacterized protein n=1 Tax=Volvox africanus TaxID=51714 RepID=A0A8J4B9M9_9CHLO|nr:hypothetical protein Vafri_12133 [Volvox africanus]